MELYYKYQETNMATSEIQKKRILMKDIMANWSDYPNIRNKLTFRKLIDCSHEDLLRIILN